MGSASNVTGTLHRTWISPNHGTGQPGLLQPTRERSPQGKAKIDDYHQCTTMQLRVRLTSI